MSNLFINYPPHWNSDDQRMSESLSKGLSLKMDSPPQLHLNARSLGFHLQDQDSPSSQSTRSNHDMTTNAGTNSQDQCMSSESGQEVNCGKNLGQMKPMYLMGHPEAGFNIGQMDYNRAMGCMPYPCGDPYYNGILNTYGTTPIIQPHMMSMTTTRVPLPLDISEDEPIFVNAKQYHGILRRRQSRAKMEAQNKLIKARKPYLHESRHLHALNRVRGSGGRFLSTKKQQQSDSTSNRNHSISGSNAYNNMVFESHQSQCMATGTSSISTTNGNSFYQQQDGGFLGISSSHTGGAMQHNGGFINNPNQHQAPVVR
ncbi:nuclear transcription factor Y subunit A-7-like isoform X1 [Chenopodium quinoa]|uniref:nuclear transcription factor Y subunit A-7-like isoform X1 n=2 Tax=Chenopodium quinoa TaxID=63459 RepID=UPI000B799337|nr:nuclear transcription factor Y subunit A-7-like isoform X1 [Chenopodium quinoa]